MPRTIKDWKEDIRDLILRVREQMIGFIDGFTSRIIKQISRIEQDKREVAAVSSQDRRQGERLDFIKEKLVRTNEILKTIEDTQPNMRADLVKTQIEEMEEIERLVQEKDQEMMEMHTKGRHAINKEVHVKDLSGKLFGKFMNYIQKEVDVAMNEKASLIPLSWKRYGITQEST